MAHIGQNTGKTNLSPSPVDLTGVDFLKVTNFILKKVLKNHPNQIRKQMQADMQKWTKMIKNDQKWSNM